MPLGGCTADQNDAALDNTGTAHWKHGCYKSADGWVYNNVKLIVQ